MLCRRRVHRLGQLAQEGQGLGRQVGIAHADGRRLIDVVQQLVDEDQGWGRRR